MSLTRFLPRGPCRARQTGVRLRLFQMKEFPFRNFGSLPKKPSETAGFGAPMGGSAATSEAAENQTPMGVNELARLFNTVVVATQSSEPRDFPAELVSLMESAPFRAILNAVRQHARLHSIPERDASEEIIRTFRKLDELWKSYLIQEGTDRLGGG